MGLALKVGMIGNRLEYFAYLIKRISIMSLFLRSLLLLLSLSVLNLTGDAQEYSNRTLRVLTEAEDTMSVMARYTKDGTLFYLHQSYLSYEGGETYVHYEEYRRNRFWTLWQYKEVLKKERRRVSTYQELSHGPQYQFTEDGKLLYLNHFELGEEDPITKYWEYYPNGAVKFVAEIKDNKYWNFLEYYFPSGDKHEFGDFSNGQGVFVHLDDDGNPCVECQTVGSKSRGRNLCNEEEKE